LGKLPPEFDLIAASAKFPVMYEQSMNTVLTQELERYNILTKTIKNSLKDLKLAIKGDILLSPTLEAALNSLKVGKVPEMWLAKSYPSLKALGGYMSDILERLEWFNDWS
jgi:dynein heavy chain